MSLKFAVDSLDVVDEPFRPLYAEKDGKFVLSVEDIPHPDNSEVERLAAKARKAETEAISHRKQLEKWKATGKTPDEVAEILKAAEEAELKKAQESGDHATILKQHQEKWAKREAELAEELNAARASERGAVVGERVMGALGKEGATEEGIDLLPERLATRIKFETKDGKRILKIMQADGETPMAGSGTDGIATIDDLVKEAKQKWPSLFKGSGASGSGTRPGNNGGASPQIKRRSELKSEREKAAFVDAFGLAAYNALPI